MFKEKFRKKFVVYVAIFIVIIGVFTGITVLDFDNDGLKNYDELLNNTNLFNKDTDFDKIDDKFEIYNLQTSPTVPQENIGKIIDILKDNNELNKYEVKFIKKLANDSNFKTLVNETGLHRDGEITEVEINFLSFLTDCPYKDIILMENFHQNGEITEQEMVRINILLEKALGHN